MRRGDETDGDWTERREGPSGTVITLGVALVLLLVFVLQNTNEADVNLLFWDAHVPLWAVIGTAAALGFVAGWVLGAIRRRGRREDRSG